MFKHVMVGVDEHRGGRDAIALGRRLVDADGTLTLVYVYPNEAYAWRGTSLPYESVEREDAAELLDKLRSETGVTAELKPIGAPSIGRGLHTVAEHVGADLIVVGSSRSGLSGRVRLHDHTRASLNGASCAVAVAPAGYERESATMREIGVAYNGSAESEHALAVARKLAEQFGARLSAFEAVSLPANGFTVPPTGEADYEDLVSAAREQIAALGGVEPHAAYGYPAEELAPYSASLDLLVVGSRDYGPMGRLVHGSTSFELARTARCPLLVLTRGARAGLPDVDEPVLEGVADEIGSRPEA